MRDRQHREGESRSDTIAVSGPSGPVLTDGGRDRDENRRGSGDRQAVDERSRRDDRTQPDEHNPPGGQPQQGQQDDHRQGAQPQQGHQRGNRGPQPQERPGTGPSQDDGLSRRQLLGGAGVAVAAGAGGWWFFLRGPSGAKAVVDDHYSAIDSLDWDGYVETFHPDSGRAEQLEDVDGWEDYFGEDVYEEFETVDWSVEGLYEVAHEETVDEESALWGFGGEPDDADVEEYKEVLAITEIDRSNVSDLDDDEDEVVKDYETVDVALSSDGVWGIWE